MAKFTKVTGKLRVPKSLFPGCLVGDGYRVIDWDGYTSDEFPGLMVAKASKIRTVLRDGAWTTEEKAEYGNAWTVIHMSSGFPVLSMDLKTRDLAAKVARMLTTDPVQMGTIGRDREPIMETIDWTADRKEFEGGGRYLHTYDHVCNVIRTVLEIWG